MTRPYATAHKARESHSLQQERYVLRRNWINLVLIILKEAGHGSNPRDMAFFEEAKKLDLKRAKIAAFGSTRRASLSAKDDPQLKLLLDANTPVVTIFGKTWLLHVTEILRTTAEENLKMIEDSVRFPTDNGRDVIYDAEHFFDGFYDNPEHALQTLESARGGAINLTLCDTNGGKLVSEVNEIVTVVAHFNTPISALSQ